MTVAVGPDVVEDGLVLSLDAANGKSYPGSGTTWTDLSGNGNTATLNAFCTYSANDGGGIVFNGSTAYVDLATTSLISGSGAFTVEAFFNNTSSYGELLGNYGSSPYQTNYLWFATAGLYINSSYYVPNPLTNTGKHHLIATRSSTGYINVWQDGVQQVANNGPNTSSIPTNIAWRIGADVNDAGEKLTGTIYVLRAYNIELSSAQIIQNYNALRGRFGI